jgi:hypothetical protein
MKIIPEMRFYRNSFIHLWCNQPLLNEMNEMHECFISLKVNTITCVIWGQKPNRLLTKERSRTSETHIIDGQTIINQVTHIIVSSSIGVSTLLFNINIPW